MIYPSFEEFKERAKQGNLIPVYTEILADMETPVSAFLKIRNGNSGFLLESVEGGEKIGRHSFLGSNPSLLFKSKDGRVEIIDNGSGERESYQTTNPLTELKGLLERYCFVEDERLPRFCGGLVGYFSYDLVRFFEKLPNQAVDDLQIPDCILVFTDTLLVFDHVQKKIIIISNAHIEGGNVRRAYDEAIEKIEAIVKKLSQPVPFAQLSIVPTQGEVKPLEITSNFTQAEFEQAVVNCKEYIRAGDVIQVVISQRLSIKLDINPFDIYRALRSINPSPFMYFLEYEELKIVGSSPEVMVRLDSDLIEVRPIAGTRRRGATENEDEELMQSLLADPKERAEHIMLVDLGRNDVGRVSQYKTVRVNDLMTIEKYSHVMHIVSDVTGQKEPDKDQFDVFQACFPAGTVSGAPKIRAMEIIEELEPTKRGPYAGAIGYFSFSGNLDSCITIRTLVVRNGQAFVQAGAGIVADSEPEREYHETMNKARALLKAVELVQVWEEK